MTCNQRLFFCSFQWANWVRFGSFWFDINRVQYCFGRRDPELDTFPQHVDVWLIIYKSALKPLHINFSRWGHIQVDVHEIRFFIIRMYQQLDVAIHQSACNDGRESKSSPAVQLCPHLRLLLLFSRSRAGIFQIRTLSTSPTRSNGISNGFIPIRFSISKQKRLGAIHSDWTLFFYKKKKWKKFFQSLISPIKQKKINHQVEKILNLTIYWIVGFPTWPPGVQRLGHGWTLSISSPLFIYACVLFYFLWLFSPLLDIGRQFLYLAPTFDSVRGRATRKAGAMMATTAQRFGINPRYNNFFLPLFTVFCVCVCV